VAADYYRSFLWGTCLTGIGDIKERKNAFLEAYKEEIKGKKNLAKKQVGKFCKQDKKALPEFKESSEYLYSVDIGKEALKEVNKARKNEKNLPKLKWDDELHLRGLVYLMMTEERDVSKETKSPVNFNDDGEVEQPLGSGDYDQISDLSRVTTETALAARTVQTDLDTLLASWKDVGSWEQAINNLSSHAGFPVLKNNGDYEGNWAFQSIMVFSGEWVLMKYLNECSPRMDKKESLAAVLSVGNWSSRPWDNQTQFRLVN